MALLAYWLCQSQFYWKMEVMEVSYKKLNTQWPIWEIIATAAAGWGGNEEKYDGIFLGQNRKYLLHQYASLCPTSGSYLMCFQPKHLGKKNL